MVRRTRNYLNNRDLLIEIHKSKTSFCEYDDPKYSDYDEIIHNLDVLTDDDICQEHYELNVHDFIKNIKQKKSNKAKKEDPPVDLPIEDILTGDLVFRYMTFSHIPLDESWPDEKVKKKASDGYVKLKFPPFQHLVIENGLPKAVGYSHRTNGEFDAEAGSITDKLGHMFMLLVEKIGKKGNWRNYTYNDEMRCSALLQLSQFGLRFDESRGQIPNPFAFYTTVVNNAFKRVLNTEKKSRDIRDDLIEIAGQNPSFSRQMENYIQSAEINNATSDTSSLVMPNKRAPKSK